ncbi:MAG: Zn-ribbon domain-containing OB-fold protein, partial [Acidimicrobiales bacterium]
PRPRCASCGGTALGWAPASGRARLVSFTVLHRAPPEHRHRVPYVYAVVDLEEGPRMVTNVVGADPSALGVGDDLEVTFGRTDADGQRWPDFRPVPHGGAG